jgi:hypothetical protein
MKIITLEEHFVLPEILNAWQRSPTAAEDGTDRFGRGVVGDRLADLGDRRLAEMDDEGVDVQVLSLNVPGVQNRRAVDAVPLARDANDLRRRICKLGCRLAFRDRAAAVATHLLRGV